MAYIQTSNTTRTSQKFNLNLMNQKHPSQFVALESFKTVNEAVDYMESYIIASKFNKNEKNIDFSDCNFILSQQEIDDTTLSLLTQIAKYNSNKNI